MHGHAQQQHVRLFPELLLTLLPLHRMLPDFSGETVSKLKEKEGTADDANKSLDREVKASDDRYDQVKLTVLDLMDNHVLVHSKLDSFLQTICDLISLHNLFSL